MYGVVQVQVHGRGDGGVNVAVLLHIQSQGNGRGYFGIGLGFYRLRLGRFFRGPVKEEPEQEPQDGQGAEHHAHRGDGQNPAVRVPFFHELAAAHDVVFAVEDGRRGRAGIGIGLPVLLAQVSGVFLDGFSLGQAGRNGQGVDDGAAVVGNQVYRRTGLQGETGVESAVGAVAAAEQHHGLARTQFGAKVALGNEALAQAGPVIGEVATAVVHRSGRFVVQLHPAQPAAVIVQNAGRIRLGHHLGNDEVAHVLGVQAPAKQQDESCGEESSHRLRAAGCRVSWPGHRRVCLGAAPGRG